MINEKLKNDSKNTHNGSAGKKQPPKAVKKAKGVYVIRGTKRKNEWDDEDYESLKKFFKRETNELQLLRYYSFLQIKSVAVRLELPCAIYSTEWTEKDDELVRIAYRDSGVKISERFSEEHQAFSKLKLLGREAYMIKCRAITLGLLEEKINNNRASTVWSNYEVSVLRKEYPHCGCNIAELLDLGRTLKAIESKANSLGLDKGAM